MQRTEYVFKLIGVLAIILLLLWLIEISPDIFRAFVGNVNTPDEGLNLTSYFLWRSRVIDTIVQGIVILAGLLGVLIYVLRGDRE